MNKKRIGYVFLVFILVTVTALGMAGRVQAVEFDEDGLVGKDEIIDDDLFIAAEIVTIDGTVNGDVFAGGGAVIINGIINGSLFTGAQTIILDGEINGSVYGGSSTLTLKESSTIARNLYYGGFNLNAEPGSSIQRDLLVGAYQVLLSGDVGRDVRAGAGALEINGSIGGDVLAEVGSPDEDQMPPFWGSPPGVDTIVPMGLRVSQDAEIMGKLHYKSAQNMDESILIHPGAGVEYEFIPPESDQTEIGNGRRVGTAAVVGRWIFKQAQAFATLLLLGGLAVWLLPDLLRKTGARVEKETLSAAGWGLVTILIVYSGAVLAAGLVLSGAVFFGVITLGGLAKTILAVGFSSLGLSLAIFGLLVTYLSKLVVCFITGKLILEKTAPEAAETLAWPLVLGIIIYILLRAVPFFGWWVGILVTLVGTGAVWLVLRDSQKAKSVSE